MVAHTCNPEPEGWAQADPWALTSQPSLASKSQDGEEPSPMSFKNSEQCLETNSQGCPLSCTGTHVHMHTHSHTCTHKQKADSSAAFNFKI